MASSADRRAWLTRTSSGQSSNDSSFLQVSFPSKRPTDTPCTRFSLTSSNFQHSRSPPKNSAIETAALVVESNRSVKPKGSFALWSLRVARSQYGDSLRGSHTGEKLQSRPKSRWWQPNRSASNNERKKSKISPLFLPGPDGSLHRRFHNTNPPSLSGTMSQERKSDSINEDNPPAIPQRHPGRVTAAPPLLPRPLRDRLWADADHDKNDLAFSRIDPDGWNKVVPKQWVEDQFSEDSSRDSRSIYTQDNGEEELKRRLKSRLTPAVNEHGFLAGEATPFDPLTSFQEEPAVDTGLPDGPEHQKTDQKTAKQPRWPFQSCRRSISSGPSVHGWLESVRPSSEHYKASPISEADTRDNVSKATEKPKSISPTRSSTIVNLTLIPKKSQLSRPKPRRKATNRKASEDPLLLPKPLVLRNQARKASPPAQREKEITTRSKEDDTNQPPASSNLKPPALLSPRSSYATILCPSSTDISDIAEPTAQPLTHTGRADNVLGRKESDINKPLPLPPDEAVDLEEYEAADARNLRTIASLNDSIDEILDLYYYRDEENHGEKITSDEQQEQKYDQAHKPSHTLTPEASPATNTRTRTRTRPTLNAVHKHKTLQTSLREALDGNPIPDPAPTVAQFSTLTSTTASPPPSPPTSPPLPTCLFTAQAPPTSPHQLAFGDTPSPLKAKSFIGSFPVFFDARSYPELAHGRTEEDRAPRRRRSIRAVEISVDAQGGTWM